MKRVNKREPSQKDLGLFLDEKFKFVKHIDGEVKKVTKNINLMRKLNLMLPCSSLLAIYKSYVRPHLVYGDTV